MFVLGMALKVVTGSRWLGSFIGDMANQAMWLGEKGRGLEGAVQTLARVVHQHPQAAYAGIKNFLQQEWNFVQRFIQGV